MITDIKPYLPYYFGQLVHFDNHVWRINRISHNYVRLKHETEKKAGLFKTVEVHHHEIKPILRRIESITEAELTHFLIQYNDLDPRFILSENHFEIKHDTMRQYYRDALTTANENEDMRLGPKFYFDAFHYLLSLGIWLFDPTAFNNGLIIDAATIKPESNG